MSMKIQGGAYVPYDVQRAQGAKKSEGAKEPDRDAKAQDAYVSGRASGEKPTGLYRVGQDENGARRIFYDDPKRPGRAGEPEADKKDAGKSPAGGPAEKCSANTDETEREIRQLKEKKQKLEQQIRAAAGKEEDVRKLEQELAKVESELSEKDNDTYRRQHTVFS